MGPEVEVTLAEILAARLGHELAGPLGAIANGVEFLAEDPSSGDQAIGLIAQSAATAARRLQFYRVAYGSREPVPAGRARQVTLDLFADGRAECDWPETLPDLPPAGVKLACNLLLLGAHAIPRGGRVSLFTPEGAIMAVVARGPGAALPDAVRLLAAGGGDAGDLNPHTIHAAFTASLARRLGGRIRLDQAGPDDLLLAVLPAP